MTTTHAEKTQDNKRQAEANAHAFAPAAMAAAHVVDNRPQSAAQGDMQAAANASPRVLQLKRFQEMADNSPQVKRLGAFQMMANNAAGQTAIQLKNQVPLKDKGTAKRTTGSGPVLRAAVASTISSKNLTDMRDTADALRKSIKHREDAPEIGVEETDGGHDFRIALEQELLGDLNAAIATVEEEERQKSTAKSNAELAKMPDLGLKRGPTGAAWGKK